MKISRLGPRLILFVLGLIFYFLAQLLILNLFTTNAIFYRSPGYDAFNHLINFFSYVLDFPFGSIVTVASEFGPYKSPFMESFTGYAALFSLFAQPLFWALIFMFTVDRWHTAKQRRAGLKGDRK